MSELKGLDLLRNPVHNKGTAFTEEERNKYSLNGFLPARVESIETQLLRVQAQLSVFNTDLERYIYLSHLQDLNETLFYNVIMSDPARFLPIVYDPTVGEACLKYSTILRSPRGIYLSHKNKGKVKEILANWPEKDVRFIVITDGGRILGLGDLGANGMGIPIGKLALYTAIGGVPPLYQLPVFFDVGTNNNKLLNDDLYIGLRQKRVEGDEYYELMDEFVEAVKSLYPKCCIQFEDFANYHAIGLLEKYRDHYTCFNDDIQGTASVTVAGFYSANKILNKKISDHKILFLGAGSAGTGIANLLCSAMVEEGLSIEEARKKCWLFDTKGLVVKDRERLETFKQPFAHDFKNLTSFLDAVKEIKPTAIVGVSTQPKLFTPEVIKAMAEINERPIIFPLSNPTSQEECSAEDAYKYSDGRALFAAGVLFDEVEFSGKKYYPAQANNLWIYPAVGMAIYATQGTRVTDEMFLVAAKCLADQVTHEQREQGMLFPPMSSIIQVAEKISAAVAKVIFDNNLARVERPDYDDHIIHLIQKNAYNPFYK